MRNQLWLIAAAAVLAATPAAAQNNMDEPVIYGTNEATNVAIDVNAVSTPPVDNALEPVAPTASELANQAAVDDDEDRAGFPWGLIGLVGLIGLLGRRKG